MAQATDLNDVPNRTGAGPTVYLRDGGYAENAADILTSHALVAGKCEVYIAATQRADASTLEVVGCVRDSLPTLRAAIPKDSEVSLELDQSSLAQSSNVHPFEAADQYAGPSATKPRGQAAGCLQPAGTATAITRQRPTGPRKGCATDACALARSSGGLGPRPEVFLRHGLVPMEGSSATAGTAKRPPGEPDN